MKKRALIIDFLHLICSGDKKAAPRFELGIKDLQSSALPLGHAADLEPCFSTLNRISRDKTYLLVLSNGHGEDVIAMRILEVIHRLLPSITLEVLPLVGEGKAFSSAINKGWLKKVGPTVRLPSGGFSNQSLIGLIQDIQAGIFSAALHQWFVIKRLVKEKRVILAVGDLLPLLFAWSTKSSFVFVGTPKSDYTWKRSSRNSLSDFYHRLKGSEWDPWEWALMKSPRCKFVAVRDHLTARGLRRNGVRALAPGNPMMDGLEQVSLPQTLEGFRRLLLLCGSRMPEALHNFRRLLISADLASNDCPLVTLVALGAEPTTHQIGKELGQLGFTLSNLHDDEIASKTYWVKGNHHVFVGSGKFSSWASWAEVGLANAGTATEQLVGLGVPAFSLPGKGPQFKHSFALRQSRLLGGSVIPCKSPEELADRLIVLLKNDSLRQSLGDIGRRRMGSPGGSDALASMIIKLLLVNA